VGDGLVVEVRSDKTIHHPQRSSIGVNMATIESPAELQRSIHDDAARRWPDMDATSEALALAEEAGEVCRAVLKRHQGVRGTSEQWSEQLRTELAQVVVVAINLAAVEGFDLYEAVVEEHRRWVNTDPNHDPIGAPDQAGKPVDAGGAGTGPRSPAKIDPRELSKGTAVVHLPTSSFIVVHSRKSDDTGWWNTDGSGLNDRVFDDGDWVPLPDLVKLLDLADGGGRG
jgi:NTP pyrophosphatase (non-canonical NTP hydrolase)